MFWWENGLNRVTILNRALISPVLYIYDYLLTLSDEVSAIWPSKFTGAKLIFLLNRYSFLLSCTISIVGQAYLSTVSPCSQSLFFLGVSLVMLWKMRGNIGLNFELLSIQQFSYTPSVVNTITSMIKDKELVHESDIRRSVVSSLHIQLGP